METEADGVEAQGDAVNQAQLEASTLRFAEKCYRKAQNGPKALYNMVFRPKSLKT